MAPYPGHTLAIDFFGPLGGPYLQTKRGNRFALILVDVYSQYLATIPVKDKESTTVTQLTLIGRYFFLPNANVFVEANLQITDDKPHTTSATFSRAVRLGMRL